MGWRCAAVSILLCAELTEQFPPVLVGKNNANGIPALVGIQKKVAYVKKCLQSAQERADKPGSGPVRGPL